MLGVVREAPPPPEHWEEPCRRKQPWVAIIDDAIAGFLEVDPDPQRQAIMAALVRHAKILAGASGLPRWFVEASNKPPHSSKPKDPW